VNTNIINPIEAIVKWAVVIDPTTDLTGVPDGVYPFSGLNGDQWAVVVGERQVRWARDYGVICLMFAEVKRIEREHLERNPANELGAWWTVRKADFTMSVDRATNEVSYEDAH
jgi:hypothetical protein